MYDHRDTDAEPIDQPEHDTRAGWCKPIPPGELLAIIDRHRSAYLARDFDFDLRRPARKLTRGSPEHAAAFRSAPQWHQHIGIGPTGRKANIIDLIRDEARQAFGTAGGEAIEGLL